ncbi:MAG: glycoside hydrolase family 97 catalytic domain-containing protein [Saprospiraceae bacterium]
MKKILFFLFLLASMRSGAQAADALATLKNESGSMRVLIHIDAQGQPYYRVFYREKMVLDTSYLGIVTSKTDFSRDLAFLEVSDPMPVRDQYTMHHGKQKEITYQALQYVVRLETSAHQALEVYFNLSENGLAFCYQLSQKPGEPVEILRENSTFGFGDAVKAWMQPMSKSKSGWKETNPSYEEHYSMGIPVSQASPIGEGYVYPALFQAGETWVLLSETNVHRNYCGSRLLFDPVSQRLRVAFPQEQEIFPGGALLPNGRLPFSSPWRILAIGTLGAVVESTLGTDLAAPALTMDTDFIHGGLASWSWVLLKDDFTNYETSRRFIDYAAEMHWPFCLIDADWDWKIGYERMQELVDYAASKQVGILLWYNSSGDWNSTTYTPKSKLVDPTARRAEFARLQKMGVAGCKIDFFGGDGQSMIAYYHDILKDAGDHRLLLNFHGATLPRGWHRSYPNLMTVEAIKGEEFITFEQANADLQPSHCAVIPFTRNVFDPMDFTPMVLDSIPNIQRRTSPAFELALPILFASGVQHIAEIPEGMQKMPAAVVNLLKEIPTQWDETRFVAGYPGKDVLLARRKESTWYLVGINGEASEKSFDLDLSFIDTTNGVLFYDENKSISERRILKSEINSISVGPYGGFVMKF